MTGPACSYLEPRYKSDNDDFTTVREMMNTLELYFLISNKAEEFRHKFYDLKIGQKDYINKTFTEFMARFRSTAILDKISKTDWFYQI